MKASDYIVQYLYSRGVRQVFELSGGMITHLLNSLNEFEKIKVVSMHHEQSAAFAADAVGRITGIPGVALATSGPGATNLLTGIASCYFDSTPAVFITGQVPRNEIRPYRSKLRQLGFQECDIVSMAENVCKQAWQVTNIDELPLMMHNSFQIATEGRPGPVLLDIPFDIQSAEIEPSIVNVSAFEFREKLPWKQLHKSLATSERPLILAGNGIRVSNAVEEFRSFVQDIKIPVVHSLLAKDLLEYKHPQRVGMIGSYGNRWANHAIAESDFLLVLGSRLDVKQTGTNVESLTCNKIIYHVDFEEAVINSRVPDCIPIVAPLKSFLKTARHILTDLPDFSEDWNNWAKHINTMRELYSDMLELTTSGINPNEFMHQLSKASPHAGAYVVDTGQNQMWAAQSLELDMGQRFITSGGLGAMGFGLPAAIGAAIALKAPVVCIVGDAGLQCNIQELQTIVRNKLPIKIVVLNNRCHGLVRQFQETYFKGSYQSTILVPPDFCAIASAYKIRSFQSRKAFIQEGLNVMWQDPTEPFLLEVPIDIFANVYPKLTFGSDISSMEPRSHHV